MRSRVFHSGEPAADVEFCLVFPRESLSVPVMRRVLGDTLTRLGVDESCINDLLLAVTEACTNVLRHAGPAAGTSWWRTSAASAACWRSWTAAAASIRPASPAAGRGSGIRSARLRRLRRHQTAPDVDRARLADDAAQPDRPVQAAGQGAGDRRAARVRARPGDHAGLRRRRDHAQQAGPGHRRLAAQADRVAQRRAAGSAARLTAQGRRLSR